MDNPAAAVAIWNMDTEDWIVSGILCVVGIKRVGDTFFGGHKVRDVIGDKKNVCPRRR
jgi:hypothetical protein